MSNPQYRDVGSTVDRVIEECSELIQALCKARRFGWFNHHPDRPTRTNMDDVLGEMDDVREVMTKLDANIRELPPEWLNESTAELCGGTSATNV
ncbi:hypothetical protein [Rhodoferax sp.]|uniref:hypothetical protein n=1 Tax=Rhodoferax sp. TaxID=50421 RepID=UPI00275A64A3|nr:hypothetical protein [Rhodoferax sp.]